MHSWMAHSEIGVFPLDAKGQGFAVSVLIVGHHLDIQKCGEYPWSSYSSIPEKEKEDGTCLAHV